MAGSKASPSTLAQQLSQLLESGALADITFDVSGQTYRAHKCVLAARSPVFLKLAEGLADDAAGSRYTVCVNDVESAAFKALLHFIYTDSVREFEDIAAGGTDPGASIELAQQLLPLAERYEIEKLKFICEGIISDSDHAATSPGVPASVVEGSYGQLTVVPKITTRDWPYDFDAVAHTV